MKCPNCKTEMELEDYNDTFRDNYEQVELLEHFWCTTCDKTIKQVVLYSKEKEWEE